MGWGCYRHEVDMGSEAAQAKLKELCDARLGSRHDWGRDGAICPFCWEELEERNVRLRAALADCNALLLDMSNAAHRNGDPLPLAPRANEMANRIDALLTCPEEVLFFGSDFAAVEERDGHPATMHIQIARHPVSDSRFLIRSGYLARHALCRDKVWRPFAACQWPDGPPS